MTVFNYLKSKDYSMNKLTGNEPANSFGFTTADGSSHVCEYGLTIRQHFAAMAMQGLIASTDWNESFATDGKIKASAELSVKYADALIAELNKPTTNEPATI